MEYDKENFPISKDNSMRVVNINEIDSSLIDQDIKLRDSIELKVQNWLNNKRPVLGDFVINKNKTINRGYYIISPSIIGSIDNGKRSQQFYSIVRKDTTGFNTNNGKIVHQQVFYNEEDNFKLKKRVLYFEDNKELAEEILLYMFEPVPRFILSFMKFDINLSKGMLQRIPLKEFKEELTREELEYIQYWYNYNCNHEHYEYVKKMNNL